jgi:hypothetical protein
VVRIDNFRLKIPDLADLICVICGRASSGEGLDYFGGKPEQCIQITEIGILTDDHIRLVASEVPNSKVRRSVKSDVVDMRRLRIDVRQVIDKAWGEVLVEEELHSRLT